MDLQLCGMDINEAVTGSAEERARKMQDWLLNRSRTSRLVTRLLNCIPDWLTSQLLVGVLCGGLAGAMFNYFVTRQRSMVVECNLAKSTLGADAATKSLIPTLKLQVGDEAVPVIYTYTVDFVPQSGPPSESLLVALTFSRPIRMFGLNSDVPSVLHHMQCNLSETKIAVICRMEPIVTALPNRFRVTLATDNEGPPTLSSTSTGIELVKSEELIARQKKTLDEASSVFFLLFWICLPVVSASCGYWAGRRRVDSSGLLSHILSMEKRLESLETSSQESQRHLLQGDQRQPE